MERYQTGALEKRKTSLGMCWYIRFRNSDGSRAPRQRVGLLADLSTKAAARRASEDLRREVNTPAAAKPKPVMLMRELVAKYLAEGMPERYSTAQSYKSLAKAQILPKWGDMPVAEIAPPDVKEWLDAVRTLPRKPGGPTRLLAPKTRGHVKGLMSVLFTYAMFLGAIPASRNPMTLFTISAKRKKKPRILSQAEFRKLVEKIVDEPFHTMVFISGCLGLSCSELIGIRWEDIDWIQRKVRIHTGVVNGRAGDVKNEFRRKPLPLHPAVLAILEAHRTRAKFKDEDDWVFASPYKAGENPYDPGDIRKKYIVPAATAAELGEGIGWHTFRHSYRAWLGKSGAPLEVQRDLMRHSNIATTMDIYGDTFSEDLREANETVVEGLLQ